MNINRVLKFFSLSSVPSKVVAATAIASYGAIILGAMAQWPMWALAVMTALMWLPVLAIELTWAYRNYGWLAFFYLIFISQLGHFGEHLVQMYQIHVLGLPAKMSHGVIGPLDIEWVHVIFNTWVLFGAIVLLTRYPKNKWLWITLIAATWHEIEHLYIITYYIQTGIPGNPGLLSRGGAILGGFNIARPDMHMFYNILETVPLVVAFFVQIRSTYNEWLAKALPDVEKNILIDLSRKLETKTVSAGEMIIEQGSAADKFYIVTKGEYVITHLNAAGEEMEITRRGPGDYFGEIGLLSNRPRTASVKALSAGELLALNREMFASIVNNSEPTAERLTSIAEKQLAELSALG